MEDPQGNEDKQKTLSAGHILSLTAPSVHTESGALDSVAFSGGDEPTMAEEEENDASAVPPPIKEEDGAVEDASSPPAATNVEEKEAAGMTNAEKRLAKRLSSEKASEKVSYRSMSYTETARTPAAARASTPGNQEQELQAIGEKDARFSFADSKPGAVAMLPDATQEKHAEKSSSDKEEKGTVVFVRSDESIEKKDSKDDKDDGEFVKPQEQAREAAPGGDQPQDEDYMINEDMTVSAMAVSREDLEEEVRKQVMEAAVTPVLVKEVKDEESVDEDTNWQLYVLILLLIIVLVVGLVVGLVFGLRDNSGSDSSSQETAKELAAIGNLTALVASTETPGLDLSAFSIAGSPQSKAAVWICQEGVKDVDCANPTSKAGLVELYALVTSLYIFGQEGRLEELPDDGNVCAFPGLVCSNAGRVIELDFSGQGLVGTAPAEYALFSSMARFDISDNPGLTGPLPDNWGVQWLDLVYFDVSFTSFGGQFPASLATGKLLHSFFLQGALFDVDVPKQICEGVGLRVDEATSNCKGIRSKDDGIPDQVFCPCCTRCCDAQGLNCGPNDGPTGGGPGGGGGGPGGGGGGPGGGGGGPGGGGPGGGGPGGGGPGGGGPGGDGPGGGGGGGR